MVISGRTIKEDGILKGVQDVIPADIRAVLYERDGAYKLLNILPEKYTSEQVSSANIEQNIWQQVGLVLMDQSRFHEAKQIFYLLYVQMLKHQKASSRWVHKGMPLVWIADCYKNLNFTFHWRKYLMLTLCEDVIRENGRISASNSGVYFRLAWDDMTENYLNSLSDKIINIYNENMKLGQYPEFILQRLSDTAWYLVPNTIEANHYSINYEYLGHLIGEVERDKSGIYLELLTDYIFGSMPGCRSRMRFKTRSTDLDVVCSMDGFEIDFKSEFGRYFICECKSWRKKVNFSAMAKFCRVLDSVKMKFGIMMSKTGITGVKRTTDSAREQLKIFQDRGIIIIDVSLGDLNSIANGMTLQSILKEKYEKIRLDSF